jgi:hypothetical protein
MNVVLKFVISVRGGHCDFLPLAPRNLATPLLIISVECDTLVTACGSFVL